MGGLVRVVQGAKPSSWPEANRMGMTTVGGQKGRVPNTIKLDISDIRELQLSQFTYTSLQLSPRYRLTLSSVMKFFFIEFR